MDKVDREVRRTQSQLGRWSDLIRMMSRQDTGSEVVYGYARRIADLRAKHQLAESRLEILSAAGSRGESRDELRVACEDLERALLEVVAPREDRSPVPDD